MIEFSYEDYLEAKKLFRKEMGGHADFLGVDIFSDTEDKLVAKDENKDD